MKSLTRLFSLFVFAALFILNVIPCGPSYITPVFDIRKSPEIPFENFAAGQIGVVRPTFSRAVLFAAYRYLNGGGFTSEEQKALVEVWRADFNNRDFRDDSVDEAVKEWIETRKSVVDKDEKFPDIYIAREYGGYDFFPNCTKNAFETAFETLSDRINLYGTADLAVKDWVKAQDVVFSNCSKGQQLPQDAPQGSPQWLQKDRSYQIAAAAFYSMEYDDAKARFSAIANDPESPWSETADYLVARTLIRKASLAKTEDIAKPLYEEAGQHLRRFVSSSGKFSDSSEKLLALIKYRVNPEERVRELANQLAYYGGNQNFRQDLIDYTWLMDKFESKALQDEDDRLRSQAEAETNSNKSDVVQKDDSAWNEDAFQKRIRGETLNFFIEVNDSGASSNTNTAGTSKMFTFASDRSIEEIRENVEQSIGRQLTTDEIRMIENAKSESYRLKTSFRSRTDRGDQYSGEVKVSLKLLPEFLREDEVTDWLFAYQIVDTDAYLYSLSKYKQSATELWLMTALSKATSTSVEVTRLLGAASRVSRTSPAFPTIAYHTARLHYEQGKTAEARRMIDDVLALPAELPVSSINLFNALRQKMSSTLDDYLRFALRRPFAFDFDGTLGSIDEFVAEQKKWFDPDYNKEGREAYEQKVEDEFRNERLWQDRQMFDYRTVRTVNQYFPQSVLIDAYRSPALPEYLKERFAVAIWTRAALLKDNATADRFARELMSHHPELAEQIRSLMAASTPTAREDAVLYFMVKNPLLTPFVEDGLGKTDNDAEVWDINDWWCEPSDSVYDEEVGDLVELSSYLKPGFLTRAQIETAARERASLKTVGDAPRYLANSVLAWARRSPNDRRVPEALYLMHKANGWSKWGCGSNFDLQKELGDILRRRYPSSNFTQMMLKDELDGQ